LTVVGVCGLVEVGRVVRADVIRVVVLAQGDRVTTGIGDGGGCRAAVGWCDVSAVAAVGGAGSPPFDVVRLENHRGCAVGAVVAGAGPRGRGVGAGGAGQRAGGRARRGAGAVGLGGAAELAVEGVGQGASAGRGRALRRGRSEQSVIESVGRDVADAGGVES